MSKLFFDHLIEFEEIEIELKGLNISREERVELEKIIDSMVHHRVIGKILSHLPQEHHGEFLEKYHERPFDPSLLEWINQRIEKSVEEHIKTEIKTLKKEILEDLRKKN